MLARFLDLLYCTAVTILLPSCSPAVDVELVNDTGNGITIVMPGGRPPEVRIPRDGSAVVNIVTTLGGGLRERFSVLTRNQRWDYSSYRRAFGSPGFELREHRSFGAVRLHCRIDSRGRIYLLSPTNAAIQQPSGFPIRPQ